jgi:tetratricopeptide (TPR) repeat protein
MKTMPRTKLVIFAIVVTLLLGLTLSIFFQGKNAFDRAETAWQAGDYTTAKEEYLQAIRLQPLRTDLWEKAGISAGLAGKYSEAITHLEKADALSERGWLVLAYSYVQVGDTESAQAAYKNGAKNFPSSAALYSGLATLHRSQKNWAAERIALQNQILFDEKNYYAHYRLGLLLTFLDTENALPELTSASSLNAELDPAVQTLRAALSIATIQADPSRQLVTIGRALGLVNEWELALASFEMAVQADAKNAEAWAWLGEAKQQTGQDGGDELQRAILLESSNVTVRGLRALYWNRQGNYENMLAEYSLAANVEPENPAWQAGMGDAYVKMGDLAAAIGMYLHATELAPNEPTYWRLLAVLCAENGSAIEEVGLPAAKKAVELAPENALALDALGFSYFSLGKFVEAEEAYMKALEIDPQFFAAHIHLALNYLAQGNRPAAFNSLTYVRDADLNGVDGELARNLLAQYFP